MSSSDVAPPVPLSRLATAEPHPSGELVLAADDHGAFRAIEPGTGDPLLVRPLARGLMIERDHGREVLPWSTVRGARLLGNPAGTTKVAGLAVDLEGGETLEFARMHSAGAEYLPFSTVAGGPPLVRVDRLQLMAATIVAGGGLSAIDEHTFTRAPRHLPERPVSPRPRVLPGWAPALLLVLSIVALVVFFNLSFAEALAITMILVAHEYGHVIAMRAFGMPVRGVLLLPLLGAATVPEHAFRSRWDEARVALAGPLTALPLAIVVLIAWQFGFIADELGQTAFMWTLALNVLNLIPLMPLDGGRASIAIVAGLSRRWRLVAGFAPVLLCAALVAAFGEPAAWVALAVFLVFSSVVTRTAFRRYDQHAWIADEGFDAGKVREALRDVTFAFSGLARDDADGGVPPSPMTGRQIVAIVGVYGFEVVVMVTVLLASMFMLGIAE